MNTKKEAKDKRMHKIQVLLTDTQRQILNRMILNDALEKERAPQSMSRFAADLLQESIDQTHWSLKEWDKMKSRKLYSNED